MVAEAIPEVEVEQAQGQVPETPESNPEQEVQAEAEDDFESILAELDDEPATAETTDVQVPADSPEASLEGLTPEQLLERGEQRAIEKLRQQSETTQQRNREQGLRNVLATSKGEVQQELTQAGVDTDTVLRVLAKFDQVHGTHLALKDTDIQQSNDQTVAAMKAALVDAGVKFTGDKKFEPGNSLEEYVTKIAENARKGYKSPSEVRDERKAAQLSLLKKLKAAGVEIPADTTLNVPNDRRAAGGGNGSLPSFAAFNAMDISEQEKFTPEQRTRIYANDAAARARG